MKKAVFIVNPISGGKAKDKILSTVERLLDSTKFEYKIVYTERPGHGTEIARDCSADLVVAVGGDGTVSEVAQGIILSGQPKTFGIIPCGSGDGLALHLGISRNARKAVAVLNEGATGVMDYGSVNGKPFFCTTGMGFDADVAEAFANSGKRGLWTYITTALRLWWGFKPSHYIIEADGRRLETDAAMITVGNVNQWGNQARITSLASVADGQMDVTVVRPFHSWDIPALAIRLLTGKAHTARKVTMLRGASVRILRDNDGACHFDGDPCRFGREITVQTHPAALRVAIPAKKQNKI
ncbi:MAG: diacylglycerol kinase family lipid kinase [Bacteroidales bacterium]|nr:diacylglycerol kinase family lipid kinase [Bacteroidales bacterium]